MARQLVLTCGALINEIKAIRELNDLLDMRIECLPASLHMRPERIPGELRRRLADRVEEYDSVLVGYADCGTSGDIDAVCAEFGVTRISGAHCYEFFAGSDRFADMHASEPGTFWLTDFLARHFDRFVLDGLGITDHPQLLPMYFDNYSRLVYLAQVDDADLDARAERAASTLGLRYERVATGYGELTEQVVSLGRSAA